MEHIISFRERIEMKRKQRAQANREKHSKPKDAKPIVWESKNHIHTRTKYGTTSERISGFNTHRPQRRTTTDGFPATDQEKEFANLYGLRTVAQIKAALTSFGEKVSGRKMELIARLFVAIEKANAVGEEE